MEEETNWTNVVYGGEKTRSVLTKGKQVYVEGRSRPGAMRIRTQEGLDHRSVAEDVFCWWTGARRSPTIAQGLPGMGSGALR